MSASESSSTRGTAPSSREKSKHIQFSRSAAVFEYAEDPIYRATKSRSPHAAEAFKQAAYKDALRILKLLRSSTIRPDERGTSPQEQEAPPGVSAEELIGLEQLVMESPNKILRRRRAHAKLILAEQAIQDETGVVDEGRLARLSELMSKRNRSEARRRAARAVQNS